MNKTLVVLAAAAVVAYFVLRKKSAPAAPIDWARLHAGTGPAVTPGSGTYQVPVDWQGRPRPGPNYTLERDATGRAEWRISLPGVIYN